MKLAKAKYLEKCLESDRCIYRTLGTCLGMSVHTLVEICVCFPVLELV